MDLNFNNQGCLYLVKLIIIQEVCDGCRHDYDSEAQWFSLLHDSAGLDSH